MNDLVNTSIIQVPNLTLHQEHIELRKKIEKKDKMKVKKNNMTGKQKKKKQRRLKKEGKGYRKEE